MDVTSHDASEEGTSHFSNKIFPCYLSSHGFLASLHTSSVEENKTQAKDASEGNVDAVKRLEMYPLTQPGTQRNFVSVVSFSG